MDKKRLSDFESAVFNKAQQFLNDHLAYSDSDPNVFYHYTSKRDVFDNILSSQIMHASHIRCTSDPLEFSLSMSASRDWFYSKNENGFFPFKEFSNFNKEVSFPSLPPYFVSMCKERASEDLKTIYGNYVLQLNFKEKRPVDDGICILIKCKYVDNPYEETKRLLEVWRSNYFFDLLHEFSDIDLSKRGTESSWFRPQLHLFFNIALTLKLSSFSYENEYRLVIFSKYFSEGSKWHEKHESMKTFDHSLMMREYLPLNFREIGISITSGM